MNISSKVFADMLRRISVGDVIKECAITTTEHGSSCVAVDLTNSLYVHINSTVSFGLEQKLGISDIGTLARYLSNPANQSVDATIQDNRLVFSNNGANFRYLLAKPETIPTQSESEGEDDFSEVMGIPYFIVLTEQIKAQYADMAKLVKPQFVTIKMGTRGRIMFEAGTETSNKFDMVVGNAEAVDDTPFVDVEVRVMGEHLTNILNVVSAEKPVTLRITEGVAAIVQESDFWILQHVKEM